MDYAGKKEKQVLRYCREAVCELPLALTPEQRLGSVADAVSLNSGLQRSKGQGRFEYLLILSNRNYGMLKTT